MSELTKQMLRSLLKKQKQKKPRVGLMVLATFNLIRGKTKKSLTTQSTHDIYKQATFEIASANLEGLRKSPYCLLFLVIL